MLHEFWIQYAPGKARLHLFFEGHEDSVFFRSFVTRRLSPSTRTYEYRCDGKSNVYAAFSEITRRRPDVRGVLFFVDKDLDDVVGADWPTDPRIFVTDVYSIENYLVTRAVLEKYYSDAVRLAGVQFEKDEVGDHFDRQLARFYRTIRPVMAWVLMSRRAGIAVNLNNIDMRHICEWSSDCEVRRTDQRLRRLIAASGGLQGDKLFRRLSQAARELGRLPPKRVVRGKFELWFFVEFWRHVTNKIHDLAKEVGGKVTIRPALDRPSAVAILVRYVEIPRSLDLFLAAHLSQEPRAADEGAKPSTQMTDNAVARRRVQYRVAARKSSWTVFRDSRKLPKSTGIVLLARTIECESIRTVGCVGRHALRCVRECPDSPSHLDGTHIETFRYKLAQQWIKGLSECGQGLIPSDNRGDFHRFRRKAAANKERWRADYLQAVCNGYILFDAIGLSGVGHTFGEPLPIHVSR